MERYADRSIQEHHKLQKRIINGHENSEQVRELKELQRQLAERIRNVQRGGQYSQPEKSG